MANKIFLDVGTHSGQSIDTFRNYFPNSEEYKIYCWEPDTVFEKSIKSRDVEKNGGEVFMKAAWSDDEGRKLYIDQGSTGHGNSMYHEKISGGIREEISIDVECMNFSQFILDNFSKDDYIIMKFNTEGAEFEVFPHMISTGAMEYIDVLFGEWHDDKVPIMSTQDSEKLLSDTEKIVGRFRRWYNDGEILIKNGDLEDSK